MVVASAKLTPRTMRRDGGSPRMAQVLARETGATGAVQGGTVYSDALSPPGGPVATYKDLLPTNTRYPPPVCICDNNEPVSGLRSAFCRNASSVAAKTKSKIARKVQVDCNHGLGTTETIAIAQVSSLWQGGAKTRLQL
jgi:hypothetical protein